MSANNSSQLQFPNVGLPKDRILCASPGFQLNLPMSRRSMFTDVGTDIDGRGAITNRVTRKDGISL